MGAVGGDGAYDKHKVFDALAYADLAAPRWQPIIALRKDAIIQQHGNWQGASRWRAMRSCARCDERDARAGNRQRGYHRRSLAETFIYRYKHLIGDTLKARSEANQQVESRIGCAILNRMIHLGKPQSERIEKSN